MGGRVQIAPMFGAPKVTLNDCFLEFGRGAGGGQLGALEDISLRLWKNFPGVEKDHMPENAEGKILVPAIARGKHGQFPVVNNLDVAPGRSVRSDVTAHLESPGTLSALLWGRPSGVNHVMPAGTIEFRGVIPGGQTDTDGNTHLVQISSGLLIRVDARDTKRQLIASGGDFPLTRVDSYTSGVEQTFRVSWDVARGECSATIEGTTVKAAISGAGMQMNKLTVGKFSTRPGLEISHFKMWDSVAVDGENKITGGVPEGVPLLVLSGGPEYLNEHFFKVGAGFTAPVP